MNSDLTALTDEELHAKYRVLTEEVTRRHELEAGPQRVRDICQRHCEIGGDPQDLVDQIHVTAREVEAARDGEEA